MKVEKIDTYNFYNAIQGMRNPMDSWNKSDSAIINVEFNNQTSCYFEKIGEKDIELGQKLISAGKEHAKFLRQIFVSMDIVAPLYWWKEMDQYKIGTTTNSCSTMHKLSSKPITKESFELKPWSNLSLEDDSKLIEDWNDYTEKIINICEDLRIKYLKTSDNRYWELLIKLLPESWLQKRTWTGTYANLRDLYHQRKNHKLKEWKDFCAAIEKMPYAKEFITYTKEK